MPTLVSSNFGFGDGSSGGHLFSVCHQSPSLDGILGIGNRIPAAMAYVQKVDIRSRPTIIYTEHQANQWHRVDGGYMLTELERARLLT